jgi:hypothetical protein
VICVPLVCNEYKAVLCHVGSELLAYSNKAGSVRINATSRCVRATIVAVEKQYYIFWTCICNLICAECTAHAPYCIVTCGCPAVPYFSTLSHKRQDFRKNVFEHRMCVLIFCTNLSETFASLTRIQRYILNVHASSCEGRVILVIF